MTNSLLVLGASRYQLPTIEYARSQGIKVIVADNVPENPGHVLADQSHIIDSTDREAILAMAKEEGVAAAIAPCTDVAVPTAAYVNQQLGNSTFAVRMAETLTSKLKFREFQQENGLPHPAFLRVDNVESIVDSLDFSEPWIIKPDRSSGSKGIFIVKNRQELLTRFAQSQTMSLNSRVCLEQFIQGYQGTLEGWIKDGRVEQVFFLDRQTASSPYVCTVGQRTPSNLPQSVKDSVLTAIEYLWSLSGVDNSVFDVDYVWDTEQATILEASPRLGGNSITQLLSLSSGVNLLEYAVKFALGHAVTEHALSKSKERPSGVVLLGVDQSGLLKIDEIVLAELESKPWVASIELHAQSGDQVQAFINGRHCLATVFIHTNSYQELVEREVSVRSLSLLQIK